MRIQDHMVSVIKRAREELFRHAYAYPPDRLEWRPLGVVQSVLDMVREVAKTPDWAYWVLSDAKPENPDEDAAEQRTEMAAWKTVAKCETVCRQKLERLFDLYRSLSDEDLARTKWLPFNGGREHTILELLDYPRWNFTYHLGQITYIQALCSNVKIDE